MSSLKIIKKRIVSVKNTQKITRAMKLVSAAKLRRATDKAHSSRPYEAELSSMVASILNEVSWSSPLGEVRPVKKTAIVIISSDRGLAGSLNANIFKLVQRRIKELAGEPVEIIAYGKRGADFFKRRGFKIHTFENDFARDSSFARISEQATLLRDVFLSGEFDRIEVFYSHFQSALAQTPTQITLLPFSPEASEEQKMFIYEPAAEQLLDKLVPMLIDFKLYRLFLEAIASEHAARMAAMESATKNAKDMIERLTLERNRARQAGITKELMEIVGGAEALAG